MKQDLVIYSRLLLGIFFFAGILGGTVTLWQGKNLPKKLTPRQLEVNIGETVNTVNCSTTEQEPNNNQNQANTPCLNQAVSGFMPEGDNNDYFRLDISSLGRIDVLLSVPDRLDLDMWLYGSNLTEPVVGSAHQGEGVDENLSYVFSTVGTYYLRLYRYGGNGTGAYGLIISTDSCQEIIQDGGFEEGRDTDKWSWENSLGFNIIYSDVSPNVFPNSGSWLAWLGGSGGDTGFSERLCQTINLSENSINTLQFYRWIVGNEDNQESVSFFNVVIEKDGNASTLLTLSNLDMQSNCQYPSDCSQQQVNYILESLNILQTGLVNLCFTASVVEDNKSTNFFIDDVSIQSCSKNSPQINTISFSNPACTADNKQTLDITVSVSDDDGAGDIVRHWLGIAPVSCPAQGACCFSSFEQNLSNYFGFSRGRGAGVNGIIYNNNHGVLACTDTSCSTDGACGNPGEDCSIGADCVNNGPRPAEVIGLVSDHYNQNIWEVTYRVKFDPTAWNNGPYRLYAMAKDSSGYGSCSSSPGQFCWDSFNSSFIINSCLVPTGTPAPTSTPTSIPTSTPSSTPTPMPSKADLIIENIEIVKLDPPQMPCSSYQYRVYVKNNGQADANKSYLRTDIYPPQPQRTENCTEYISYFGTPLAPIPGNNLVSGDILSPGEHEQYSDYFNPSADGEVQIKASADRSGLVDESNELNNVMVKTFSVDKLFDLSTPTPTPIPSSTPTPTPSPTPMATSQHLLLHLRRGVLVPMA